MTLACCFLCHTFCFIVCGIFSGIESGGFLIDCVLLYRGCRYIYQEGVRILLAGLTPSRLCDSQGWIYNAIRRGPFEFNSLR